MTKPSTASAERCLVSSSRYSTILVVDEDSSIRDVLVQKLEALGYWTLEARNGREALDQVALEPPDLILLDVMMPVMDGFQA